MVVLFYKAAMNTELANPALWGNAGLGSYKPLVLTFLSTPQYITLFYVCFCLKIFYLIDIVDSLTLGSWPTAQ